jgi:hypothetical protein
MIPITVAMFSTVTTIMAIVISFMITIFSRLGRLTVLGRL